MRYVANCYQRNSPSRNEISLQNDAAHVARPFEFGFVIEQTRVLNVAFKFALAITNLPFVMSDFDSDTDTILSQMTAEEMEQEQDTEDSEDFKLTRKQRAKRFAPPVRQQEVASLQHAGRYPHPPPYCSDITPLL